MSTRAILLRGIETTAGHPTFTAIAQMKNRIEQLEKRINDLVAENRVLVSGEGLDYVDDESDLSYPEGVPRLAVVKKSDGDQRVIWSRSGLSGCAWKIQWVQGSVQT